MRISDWSSDVCSSDLPCELLSSATGEFGHILVEGLRSQLQPLDRSQIGEDRRAEIGCGHSVLDRQHQRLNRIRAFGGQNLAAEQPVACLRSEEPRVGTERVSTCKSWWSRYN